MARNGGTLTLTTRNGMAAAGSPSGTSGHVDLIVRDTGEGMPRAVLARVFEPFFTTKDPAKGTGLGLAQVHGFIKQSGGEIFLDSMPGEGTSVTLRLPRAPEMRVTPEGHEREIEQMMGIAAGRRVLAVDDNPDVAAFVISMLQDLGYKTEQASHAGEALLRLERGPRIDAIFSDIVMPGGMNGLDLAAIVREKYPDIAVVLASGYSDALVSYEGPRLWEILMKPYRLDELGAALERALARKPRLRRSAA
jgi:CheY-like chemotaxis protein